MAKIAFNYLSSCFQFLTKDVTTITILVAVVAVCSFAFVFGAEPELVFGLLTLGLTTAVVEARMHDSARDK